MGRPSNTEQRKDQIIKGLMAAMAKRGYEGASIREIAKEARLTPGLIHYHFKSKREILVSLVHSLIDLAEKRYEKLSAHARQPSEKLNALIDAYLAPGPGASPKSVAAWVVIGAESIRQKEVRHAYEEAIIKRKKRITQILNELYKGRGGKSKYNEQLAAGVVSFIEGAFLLASSAPGAIPKGFAAKTIKKMIRGELPLVT